MRILYVLAALWFSPWLLYLAITLALEPEFFTPGKILLVIFGMFAPPIALACVVLFVIWIVRGFIDPHDAPPSRP